MTAQSITAPRFEPCELATEMSSLSLSDQAEALNELFGRGTPAVKDEDPDVIKEALQALFQEISCIKDKSAFRQALQQCPAGYAQSDQFCLMFLRAERFDASRAAQRVVKYWEEKLKLFGPRKAFRRLTIHDLEPKDVETLREGGIRMLPGRDASGRGLLYIDRTKWNRDRDSMVSSPCIVPWVCWVQPKEAMGTNDFEIICNSFGFCGIWSTQALKMLTFRRAGWSLLKLARNCLLSSISIASW
jgi:hypothetical protein